ncbi:MAG: hypothetical protein AMXMBFR84_04260 [Candidatus Hydrogenedentota bacterium]
MNMHWLRNEDEEEGEEKKEKNGFPSFLLKTRTIVLSGQVDQELAEKVISQLIVLDNDNSDPIKIIVTTQGGHVDSGYAIHDMMRFVRSEVYTIGAGWVASIGVPILLGAPKKENRVSLPNTRFLLHQPSGGAGGQLQDLRIEAQEILKIRQKLNELIATESGQTVDKIAHDSDRNFWMSAEEARKYGLVSRVIKNVQELGGK